MQEAIESDPPSDDAVNFTATLIKVVKIIPRKVEEWETVANIKL
eukprot:gene4891-2364_t